MFGVVPVETRKVITPKGSGTVREELTKDVNDWARSDIILLFRKDAADTVAQQIKLGNPPTVAVIDKTKGKPITEAVRTIDITFGDALKPKALAVVESELRKAIEKSTKPKSGRLAQMKNWEWVHVRNGQGSGLSLMGGSGIQLGPRDFLALKPVNVPHATVANRRVSGGSLSIGGGKRKDGTRAPIAKKNQGLGFLAYAARRAARHPLLKAFRVRVVFTQAYKVPGELSKLQGTGYVMITPETGKRRGW